MALVQEMIIVSGTRFRSQLDDNANDVSKLDLDCYGDSDGNLFCW